MAPVPRTDVLLAVFGGPHRTDLVSTTFRLAHALLDRGATLQVWTCGDATGLTRRSLGDSKPRNVVDWTRDHPSTAAVARGLIADHPGRLHWYVCRFCSDERGMGDQIPEVRRRPPFTFHEHTQAAGKALTLGVC
ncbi:hypothetical protein GCM10023347_02200 [Streptomyces chumphonensis]|uniref:Uncharacterized protein n=1 Tax=Streptomyces chumphonensis TaxID=1214925 RepID=A0A927F3I2_9ACTN|nr:hypothetical protein [Streptomyces chumphonensis]MBD3934568.1 hypothetical protein [Streptomyces chumphonensis]